MESKQNDSFESLKKELDDLRRSNSVAIQLYKATESDLEVLITQHKEVMAMYEKLNEAHLGKIRETMDMLNKAREERSKITSPPAAKA